MYVVQQVGQTLTENIFCYIFRQKAEKFPAKTHPRAQLSNIDAV